MGEDFRMITLILLGACWVLFVIMTIKRIKKIEEKEGLGRGD